MTKIDNFTREEFEKIVQNSSTFSEISIAAGYSKNSTATEQIKKKCEQWNISLEHLTGYKKSNKELTFEDIFIENSQVAQSSLRRYYLKGEYSPYVCSICGQPAEWNGKPLSLTLDHINGDNKDNRLENLRWVCPNCDRQLPTFCGKNIKHRYNAREKNFCVDCGKEIVAGSERCLECHHKTQYHCEHPSREELKDLIRNFSFVELGKRYGVSDNAIRKWCLKEGLPTKKSEIKVISDEDWLLI